MSSPYRLFTLSPTAPLYEQAAPADSSPYARAFVNFRNVHLLAFGGAGETMPSLKTLAQEDWMYLSSTSAAPATEDTEMIQNWERSSLLEVAFQLMNTSPGRQFLLRVRLMALGEYGRVRLALSRRVLQTHDIANNDKTTLSLLIDVPSTRDWIYIDVKHIQCENGKASALKVFDIAGFLV